MNEGKVYLNGTRDKVINALQGKKDEV